MITPIWISREMHAPDPPVIANGVVYALQTGRDATESRMSPKPGFTIGTNAILYALDAQTGKELWSSGDDIKSWVHNGELSVANGRVYIGTFDGALYCYGIAK